MNAISAPVRSARPRDPRPYLPPQGPTDGDNVAAVRRLLSVFHDLAADSEQLYASPSEAFFSEGGAFHLPRFVFFGARGAPGALRLVFFAGWNANDLRGTLALFSLLHHFVEKPERAAGFNLLFYPLVNVTGFLDGTAHTRLGDDLEHAEWGLGSGPPELRSVAADFPRHATHGWVTLGTHPQSSARLHATVRRLNVHQDYLPIDASDLPVDWEPARRDASDRSPGAGLASVSPTAFGVSLDAPAAWTAAQHVPTVVRTLHAIIERHRQSASFGGEL